jgi:hypothetical protein
MNGNVGIGTWLPDAPLNVNGGIDMKNGSLDYDAGQGGYYCNAGRSSCAFIGIDVSNNLKVNQSIAFAQLQLLSNGAPIVLEANGGNSSFNNDGSVTFPAAVTGSSFSAGSNCFYRCVGGVDAGVIQTSACNLCPAGTCTLTNICGS